MVSLSSVKIVHRVIDRLPKMISLQSKLRRQNLLCIFQVAHLPLQSTIICSELLSYHVGLKLGLTDLTARSFHRRITLVRCAKMTCNPQNNLIPNASLSVAVRLYFQSIFMYSSRKIPKYTAYITNSMFYVMCTKLDVKRCVAQCIYIFFHSLYL